MRAVKIVSIIILLQFSFISVTSAADADSSGQMKVHFIDVGQGDSMLVETPHNKHILIDGGPPEAGKDVVEFLEDHQIDKIDLLITTHPDVDHIGGLVNVLKSIPVKKILDSGKLHSTKTYMRYIDQIHKHKIPVEVAKQNDMVELDPFVDIRILNAHDKHKNNNQSSIALKVTYQDVDFLLMADAERGQEKRLLKEGRDVDSDIYKVGHHGSNTSTSLPFLKAVKPKITILTYHKDNRYGHPVDRVIHNLQRVRTNLYSTAVYGDISIVTNGKGYYVFTEKSPLEGIYDQTG